MEGVGVVIRKVVYVVLFLVGWFGVGVGVRGGVGVVRAFFWREFCKVVLLCCCLLGVFDLDWVTVLGFVGSLGVGVRL